MTEAPLWSIEAFIRAHRAFDEGRGPVAAWSQLNEIVESLPGVGRERWQRSVGVPHGLVRRAGRCEG
jgi:hypothetical protein